MYWEEGRSNNKHILEIEESSCNSGPTAVIKADNSLPKQMWTSSAAELIQRSDFKTMAKVGSTNPRNIGPPLSVMVVKECRAQIWTCGDAVSCAKAINMETDVCKCWVLPMPPTYRCKDPNATEWPVLEITSRADFKYSKLLLALSATNWGSQIIWK